MICFRIVVRVGRARRSATSAPEEWPSPDFGQEQNPAYRPSDAQSPSARPGTSPLSTQRRKGREFSAQEARQPRFLSNLCVLCAFALSGLRRTGGAEWCSGACQMANRLLLFGANSPVPRFPVL